MSVFEVFGTWQLGGCVVVPRPDEVNDPDRLITMLHEQQVQMWNSAPALFDLVLQRALATGRTLPDSLRVVALGGDRFPPDVIGLARAVAPMAQLFNLAGLTETSYCSTWYRVRPEDAEGAIPWGYPLPGQQLYVLDDRLSPVPDGELGEMCIGGPGVGRGYWRRPELTALRFVADPFGRSADARMFRTGDQVRRRADGCLEFHGRLDDQIKVRGLRIEPGEIERVVERHPAVVRAVAVIDVSTAELRCYYVAKDDAQVPDEELRDLTRRYLAAHMVPARFIRLAELPLLPSGKIDRAALAASDAEDADANVDPSPEGQAPGDPAQQLVLAVYREMVGEAAIGDNFFDAGGNSLQATQFVMRVRDELDLDLPMRSLLEARTLAEFAAALDAAARAQGRTVPATPARRGMSEAVSR
jgi:acyl-coenzyme A synthetase/AMP-(fatty) acid ligase/acyl carrier protein